MNYIEKLRTNCKQTSFGIEFETCVHIIGKEYKNNVKRIRELITQGKINEARKIKSPQNALMDDYYNCLQTKSKGLEKIYQWEVTTKATNYDHWNLMLDTTVICSSGTDRADDKSCIIQLVKKDPNFCLKLDFYPIEIITPVLTIGKSGLDILTHVWFGWIMSNNFVYTTNKSQGLHINISHPQLVNTDNALKFIEFWKVFEPIILQILPEYRKGQIKDYAIPLNLSCKKELNIEEKQDIQDIESFEKYKAIRKHKIGEPDCRFEVRIYQGSMDYFEIYYWNLFCIIFVNISLIEEIEEIPTDQNNIKLFKILLDLVVDDGVQRFLLDKYRTNKKKDWPNMNYIPSNKFLFKRPWKFTEEKQKFIFEKQNMAC
jgi:hypothetical protein